MATARFQVVVQGAGGDWRSPNGLRVDAFPESALSPPTTATNPASYSPSATTHTAASRGTSGIAEFTGLSVGRYWVAYQYAGSTYWQMVQAWPSIGSCVILLEDGTALLDESGDGVEQEVCS